MTEKSPDNDAPVDLAELARELAPPADLEDRVVAALTRRRLLSRRPGSRRHLAAAAAIVLAGTAFLTGHWTGRRSAAGPPREVGTAETASRFALLLYEDEGYRPATGGEEIARYHEYSRWVAWARQREQFVAGEDLAVDAGRKLTPGEGAEATIVAEIGAPPGARLSGMFVVEAAGLDEAAELARRLPHLEHGGQVVVQRVVPTQTPPNG